MKKKILFIGLFLLANIGFAQAPQQFSYQAIVRNAGNAIVANAPVGVRVTILQGSASGTSVYVETQNPTTNLNGLATMSIGAGTVVSGSLATIDWSNGPYFIRTETDPTGGTTYTITGTSQMMSTPYALYAARSGTTAAAGATTQITYNNAGVASGAANNTWDNATNTHTVTGTSVTTNERVTALAGVGSRVVLTDATGNLFAGTGAAITGTGTTNFHTKYTNGATGIIGNSLLQDDGTSMSVNVTPTVQNAMYIYKYQLTSNGDGQTSLYGYRTRDSQNDGTAYGVNTTNRGVNGYNFWGDVYTFGTTGYSYNDHNRTGGVLGAEQGGTYWGSLGYRSSGLLNYGVYGTAAYASGAGFAANNLDAGIGGGFHGMVGAITRGNVIGQFNKGGLFASYNIGDVYTSGKNVELVSNGTEMIPAYAVTSTEAVIYKKGRAQMVNGTATISFDSNYSNLLGESPIVTITPMGQCNGVYIESVTKNGFTIRELNAGNSSAEIAWIAVGDRVDAKSTEVPSFIKDRSFDQKMDKVMFNDGNTTQSGEGLWWDGTTLQLNKNYPRELNPTREDKTKMLEAQAARSRKK